MSIRSPNWPGDAVKRLILAASVFLAACGIAGAQTDGATKPAAEQAGNPETIQIGLSTDTIRITADFSGADLTIFGSIENLDPQLARQNRYDVIVVLEGPSVPTVVRKKNRVAGMWINTQSVAFENVAETYSISSTRALQDITDPQNYRRLTLGINNLYFEPENKHGNPLTLDEFTDELRALKLKNGSYVERVGGVQFLSQGLFRASLALPPNVPIGAHKARAFLFRSGVFVKETSAPLQIEKAGLEQFIYRFAHDFGLIYGIIAVTIAVATGWIGRLLFSRD